MQPGQPRLAIDYGAACARAVLAWPDGRWQALVFDGSYELSTAVHTGSPTGMVVGAAAWQQAQTSPDGFVLSPLRAATSTPATTGNGHDDDGAEAVVAALRRIAGEAARMAGGPVEDVRVVVPARWGPVRLTWLRRAVHKAGLGQPRLVSAPVAVADRLAAVGVAIGVGGYVLVCDLGAGCEVSVLHRGPTGFEVVSTLADPDAGGAHLDDLLTAALTGPQPLPEAVRWPTLSSVRTAKEMLSLQPAVSVPLPAPALPVIANSALVAQLALPVLTRAGKLAAEALANADLTVDQLSGVYCVGAASALPGTAQVIGEQLGAVAQPVTQPGFAAVLGAAGADAGTATPAGPPPVPVPALRRLLNLALPGAASLALYTHFVLSADFHNGTPRYPHVHYYVIANWGELATAALFTLVTCLQAGTLFGAALQHSPAPATGHQPQPGGERSRIGAGIALAAAAGTAISGLYALLAAKFLFQPVAGPLRWALLPILPLTAMAVTAAWLAHRRRVTPPQGWDAYLSFPISSVAATALGTLLLGWWSLAWVLPAYLARTHLLGPAGAFLIGLGVACALARRWLPRLILGAGLGLFALLMVGIGVTGILAIIYTIAATTWWGHQFWTLARTPAGPAGHAR